LGEVLEKYPSKRRLVVEAMRFGYRLASQPPVPSVDATNQCGLFLARAVEAEVGE
jgi:hypothetical protein